MAVKNYCIIQRNGYYYIPVKAKFDPYGKGKLSYLACLPNFFGGTMENMESPEAGLIREVAEESQEKIELSDCQFYLKDLFSFAMKKMGRNGEILDYYGFYLLTVEDAGEFFEEDVCILDPSVAEASKKEMSCILKIAVDDLRGKTVEEFLDLCIRMEGNLFDLNEQERFPLSQWKKDTGTKDAFLALLAS